LKIDSQSGISDLTSIDELLEHLIFKSHSDIVKTDINEFVLNLKNAITLKSSSDIYIELQKLDSHANLNDHLRKVNLDMLGESKKYFLGFVKTTEDVKKSHAFFKIPILKSFYFLYLFLLRRFIPKLFLIKHLPFLKTLRIYSQAEIMGRLHYNGFKIIEFDKLANNLHYFFASREDFPNSHFVQEGLLIHLRRIGKSGKKFKVYKFRTMHPYSEFIHEYMIENHGFNEKGKINNDFRTSGWGVFLRRTWLDELPQLINVLKGDMKIFGVRPVSESYFKTLPPEFQFIRNQQKPGCIPPYLVFSNGSTKDQVVEAEKIYLKKCIGNKTFWIDLKYTLVAINNILLKGKRSS
jgi:lipopolysaccharide/colanic/teichoic acid biosynthesis glycosyltransferase